MAKHKHYLDNHPYKIWQGKDGNWYTHVPDSQKANNRKLIKKKNKEDLEKTVIEYWEAQENTYPLMDITLEAINDSYVKGFISSATKDRYVYDAKRYFSKYAGIDIASIDESYITKMIEEIVSSGKLKRKAFNNMTALLRKVFKYARINKITSINVDNSIEDLQISDRWFDSNYKEESDDVFSIEEAKKLNDYLLNNLDNKNLCLLLVKVSGCRISEMTVARHSDFTDNTYLVRRTQTRYKDVDGKYHYDIKNLPKTINSNREVVLPNDYLWLIDETKKYNPDGDYIFLDKNGKPYSSNVMNNRLKSICKKLDIKGKSPHKLRKTYVSALCDAGIDEKTITKQIGHSNFLTTNLYYNRNRKSISDISAAISNVPEFKVS